MSFASFIQGGSSIMGGSSNIGGSSNVSGALDEYDLFLTYSALN